MNKVCPGCGASIQTDTPSGMGYIKKEVLEKRKEDFLCERCYRLTHYNEINKIKVDVDFDNLFSSISKEESLIVNVIDAFDLLGSTITNINEMFPNSKILIIANKYDLFMRSNRPTKLRSYLRKYLENRNVDFVDVVVTSTFDEKSCKPVYETIKKYCDNKMAYIVGVANVGKSSLLNLLGKYYHLDLNITTSKQVGTTLGITKFKLGDLIIGDTPGYYNDRQLTNYLDGKDLNIVMPKKFIKPRIYQLYKYDTVFISGIMGITYLGEEKKGIAFFVSNSLMLYRTKQDSTSYLQKNRFSLLLVPKEKEVLKLGNVVNKHYSMKKGEELEVAGVGFISFTQDMDVNVLIYENIGIERRNALI